MTKTTRGITKARKKAPGRAKKTTRATGGASLRRMAEQRIGSRTGGLDDPEHPSPRDVRHLVHELRTHQIELEMQNEELRRAQEALEESRKRYADLYDLAPIGYFTFDKHGLIREVNLAGAGMLGEERRSLIGKPFSVFIHKDDRSLFHLHRTGTLQQGNRRTAEMRLKRKDGTVFIVQLQIRADEGDGSPGLCRTAMIDISDRKQTEEELESSRRQLRNLSAHLQDVREGERTHIAREIHDELGQSLTALKLDLHWLGKRLPADQPLLLEKERSMHSLIDETIESVKRITAELKPGMLDILGLAAAVEWQAQEFRKRTGIPCVITIEPPNLAVDAERATSTFRIFQEALTNITRHAKATSVTASLVREPDRIVLSVRDNGAGITEKQIDDPASFGLMGIRERVLTWGGEVFIRGARNRGTELTVTIPIDRDRRNSPLSDQPTRRLARRRGDSR